MAVLIGMSGEVAGKHFDIDRDEISIGRTEGNTIAVDDPAVSGRHCSIIKDGDGYLLRDHGSTNGTRLNAKETREARLRPKDLIRIGSLEFMFDAEDLTRGDTELIPTAVEVAPGPAAAPQSFNTISPFGARSKEGGRGWWYVLIAVVGLLALAAVVLLFLNLLAAS